jgi:hypothetical protein
MDLPSSARLALFIDITAVLKMQSVECRKPSTKAPAHVRDVRTGKC